VQDSLPWSRQVFPACSIGGICEPSEPLASSPAHQIHCTAFTRRFLEDQWHRCGIRSL